MSSRRHCLLGVGLVLLLGTDSALVGQDDPFIKQKPPPVVGRWDVTVRGSAGNYPSWFEVEQSGFRTLIGSYLGQFGSRSSNF